MLGSMLVTFASQNVSRNQVKKSSPKSWEKRALERIFKVGPAESAVSGERLERGLERQKSQILEKDFGMEFWKS